MALRDIPTRFITCEKSLCVTGAILPHRFQSMTSMFRGKRSTLETSILILRGRSSASDVSSYVVFANRIVSAASSGDDV